MKTILFAGAVAAAMALPGTAWAQQAQAPAQACPAGTSCAAPSPFLALDFRRELSLTDEQVAGIEKAKEELRDAHRVHCAPMHASTPTPEAEEKHHREMAEIKKAAEARAGAVLTPQQQTALASLDAARPRPAPAAGEHHHPAPAQQGHSGHHPSR
jgi:hypothetical protein